MPKPITLEMLHEMSTDQRKTLYKNASSMDTDAARDVLALLAQDDLLGPPKIAKTSATKTAAVKKASTKKAAAKPKKAAAPKAIKAVYGRQT